MLIKKGNIILICILFLGFSSFLVQIYLLREFIGVFYGNEIIVGVVLSSWMLMTGLGAWLGRFFPKMKNNQDFILFLQFLLAVLPVITLIKLDLWRSEAIPTGSMASLYQVMYSTVLMLTPFCLVNGFLFTAYASMIRQPDQNHGHQSGNTDPASGTTVIASEAKQQHPASSIQYPASRITPSGKAYAYEALGSIAGGLVVNFILLWFFGTFTALRILLILNLLVTMVYVFSLTGTARKIISVVLAAAICIIALIIGFETFTSGLLFPGQKVIRNQTTPYGKVTVTATGGQLNFFENGLLLFSSNNEILNEEEVHYAMLQHPHPMNILLISGGISGTTKEILKYNPERIDYVELNPSIIQIGKQYTKTLDDRRIHVYNADARRFVKNTGMKYDVVLIILPEPSTLQINRFYTKEFFHELNGRLNPGAIVSSGLPSTADYVSVENGRLNASFLRTLKCEFRNVLIIPGQKNYFLASDSLLRTDIASLSTRSGIQTLYVNRYWLDDDLIRDRSQYIFNHLNGNVPVNQDLKPVAFFLALQFWTSFFKINWLLIAALLAIIILLILVNLNAISFGLFTGGWTGSSLEILILLSFQIIYGYVFRMLAVIIMLFMTGIALGALTGRKLMNSTPVGFYIRLQITIGLFALGFPFLILLLNLISLSDFLVQLMIGIITLAIAFLTGAEYSVASVIGIENTTMTTAKNYSADLFGSAMGALCTTIFLLPLLGIMNTCFVLAFLNGTSALILFIRRKKVVSL